MNDPNEDPPPPLPSNLPPLPPHPPPQSAVSSVKKHDNTMDSRLRDKVTYYEQVWSSGKGASSSSGGGGADNEAINFGIDVNAFEEKLNEERIKRIHVESPKIEVRLRSTPQPSPRHIDSQKTFYQRDNNAALGGNESYEETFEKHVDAGEIAGQSRVYQYQKTTLRKTTREVNVSYSTTPDVKKIKYTESRSRTPSVETDNVFHTSDVTSAHNLSSNTINVTIKPSVLVTSPHVQFSHENVFSGTSTRMSPLRERMFVGNIDSNIGGIVKKVGEGGEGAKEYTVSSSSSSSSSSGGIVSSVAGGNPSKRHQQISEHRHGIGEGVDDSGSLEWYNEYKTHSFQSAAAKMNLQRSNSQYDEHIKEIRGKIL